MTWSTSLPAFVSMPIHAEPRAAMAIYTVLMSLITAGVLLWWLASGERARGPALPLLVLGGAISGLLEPFLDNVVLFWYPPHQHLVAFHAFGRTVPLFVPIGYAWFCGSLLYFVARLYERGVRAVHIWLLLGAVVIVDYLAIAMPAWLGIAGFYGHPPFDIGGYPLWWAAIDGTDVILGAAVVFFLLPRLKGLDRLWLVLVPAVMIGASAGAVGWPISTALNTGWSNGAKWVAGALTLALAGGIVHLVARFVPRPAASPVDELPERVVVPGATR